MRFPPKETSLCPINKGQFLDMQHAEIAEACEMLGVFRSIGGGEAYLRLAAHRKAHWPTVCQSSLGETR